MAPRCPRALCSACYVRLTCCACCAALPPAAAYYYITYTTIELFASSLTAKTKLKVGGELWHRVLEARLA